MATYSGIDKVGEFFAHYGRKGMKRGRNIFNPDYKPVGEIAKGPQAPGAKQSGGLAKKTIKSVPKASATSAADRQREAMNRAAGAATMAGAISAEKTRREALLEAERKRQASSGIAAHEQKKGSSPRIQVVGIVPEPDMKSAEAAKYSKMAKEKQAEARNKALKNAELAAKNDAAAQATKAGYAAMKAYDDKAVNTIYDALPGGKKSIEMLADSLPDLTEEEIKDTGEAYSSLLNNMFDIQHDKYKAISDEDYKLAKRGVEMLKKEKSKISAIALDKLTWQKVSYSLPADTTIEDLDDLKDAMVDLGLDEDTVEESMDVIADFTEAFTKRKEEALRKKGFR